MNDEIKEILEHLRIYVDDEKNGEIIESKYTMNLLLDYITNLQQENERLKEQVNENKIIVEYAIKPSFTTRKLKDYKSRCEKAIEYIKNCEIIDKDKSYPLLEEQFGEDLLNILQNGGK